MPRTLAFVGWYGRHNAGDEAFKLVHELLFPDYQKRWVSSAQAAGDPAETVYVLGAGDVFLDYYLLMIPAGAKFFVYGVGLGGPDQYESILANRDRLLGIWLRNPEDVAVLRAEGLEAHYTPDITLLLQHLILAAPGHTILATSKRKRLVFCPSGNADQTALQRSDMADHLYHGYLKIMLAKHLDEMSAYYDIVMLPLSHDYKDMDLAFIGQILGLMRHGDKAILAADELPPLDLARLIAGCQLCISMKFHGLVFAAQAGVPFVNIGLTRKTSLLCDNLGLSQLSIEPYTFTMKRGRTAVKLAEAPETALALKASVDDLAQQARTAAEAFRRAVLNYLG